MLKKPAFVLLLLAYVFFAFHVVSADDTVAAKDVLYKDSDMTLEGFVVYDTAKTGKLPGIIIVHEWNGLGDYVKGRAKQLAKMGYQVFCADIYGKGIRPKDREESGRQASMYRADRNLMRSRLNAALHAFKKMNVADNSKIAVMGYCFGGGAALELARSGADVLGAVSFHGNLDTPMPAKKGELKAKILVLHGADDKGITKENIEAFYEEMRAAGAHWQMNSYGNAVHGFTNPDNGSNTSNVAYNKEADTRSWEAMSGFFREIFEKK